MSRLIRYTPFSTEPFSDVLQGIFRPIVGGMEDAPPRMDIDVNETDGVYQLKADIPGVDKKDIEIDIDGNVVTICARKERHDAVKEGDRVVRQERFWGESRRSISLPSAVDQSQAKASYDKGVLSLSLPKKASESTSRLQIT